MLYYNLQNIDTYIKSPTLLEDVNNEIVNLENSITTYSEKYETLKNMSETVLNIINNISENKVSEFYTTLNILKDVLEKTNNNITLVENQKNNLINITKLLKDDSSDLSEIKSSLIEYNTYHETIDNTTYQLEKDINQVFNLINILLSSIKTDIDTMSINSLEYSNSKSDQSSNTNLDIQNSNLLLISEKDQKAYLPYSHFDLEKIYQTKKNTFSCLQDVIEKIYILPLESFKNSSISRFREAYKLIKEKQNGSVFKAISLGLELMFKYNLNPIIIAACRNIDELDIYLDCLDENELSAFKCFKIKFEINPKL